MIPMTMIGKVRRMFHRQNKSVREIARLTSLSRNTIHKYLNADLEEEPKYRRKAKPTQLTPFHEALTQALAVDARRPKKERRTAWMLFQEIQAVGYNGCYSRVTDFIRAWRHGAGKAVPNTAFVPLHFEMGEAFQFDWSEEGMVIGGVYRKLQVAHVKLCASRAFWLVAYPTQGHEMLFDAHTRAFMAFGGVARRGIYDNMKTAVDKVHKGRQGPNRESALCGDVCALLVRCGLLQRSQRLGERCRREERAGQSAAYLDRGAGAALWQPHRTERMAGEPMPDVVGGSEAPALEGAQRCRCVRAGARPPDAHADAV